MTSGHSDLVITAFLEEHAAFFLEEEDIPMESEQIDLILNVLHKGMLTQMLKS